MQSRRSSFIETIVNVAIGFVVSLVITAIVFPAYGYPISHSDNVQITIIFTTASILRGYVVRRWFNSYIVRLAKKVANE